VYNFNIVPLLPPTPAARVPAGRAAAAAFFCSAARRLPVNSVYTVLACPLDATQLCLVTQGAVK